MIQITYTQILFFLGIIGFFTWRIYIVGWNSGVEKTVDAFGFKIDYEKNEFIKKEDKK